MAPKRRSVVRTTRRSVMKETVEVEVMGSEISTQEAEAVSKEIVIEEKQTTPPYHARKARRIPVQSQEEAEEDQETQPPSEAEEEPGRAEKGEEMEAVKAKKGAKRPQGKKGRPRRRRPTTPAGSGGFEGYKRYVHRLMKQIHPDMEISEKAMTVVNNFMGDMFEKLADEAARMSAYTKKMTLTSREIQAAVRLVLPGELGKHAVAEGVKAVSNYVSYPNRS